MQTRFKRGITALVLAISILPLPAFAQSGTCGVNPSVPMASSGEVITVSSTAVGFTSSKISPTDASAVIAVCYVATDAIRFWDDTQTPTATVGRLIAASTNFQVCGILAVRQFRMIRVTTDASVTCSYYKG